MHDVQCALQHDESSTQADKEWQYLEAALASACCHLFSAAIYLVCNRLNIICLSRLIMLWEPHAWRHIFCTIAGDHASGSQQRLARRSVILLL